MSGKIDPIDVLHHIQVVEDTLKANENFQKKYREYADSQESLGTERRKRLPVLSLSQQHPIIPKLYQARQEVDQFFLTGNLNIRSSVLEINRIGKNIDNLSDAPLAKPDLSPIDTSIQEIWGSRLWNEEDFWDAVYELEIASFFSRKGFETYLIEEGQQRGPDVIIVEDGDEIWIECKRKRPQSERERELSKVRAKVADEVWELIDIGDDSFAIEIAADHFLEEKHVEKLATEIVALVKKKGGSRHIQIDDISISVDLVDYHEGSFTIEGPNFIQESLSISPEFQEPLNPFPHLDYSLPNNRGDTGHLETLTEASNKMRPELFNSMIYGYHLDVNYGFLVDWAMNAVETARSDLSGNPPAMGFIDIPQGKYELMSAETTKDLSGNSITLLKRFSQRVQGQLMDSSSLNGIVITTQAKQIDSVSTLDQKPFSAFLNEDPKIQLPDSISDLFTGDDCT